MKFGTKLDQEGILARYRNTRLAFAVQTGAQVQTTTTTTAGETRYNVTVNRGEVYAVDGTDLIVKMEDGTFRHFPDVPESARATVDGKQLGIHDLKPGMKLQRTITTTETPMIVTTIQTVTGKVWYVNPPRSVILTLEDNTNQEFKIPKDQKFNVDGQMVDAFALRKGYEGVGDEDCGGSNSGFGAGAECDWHGAPSGAAKGCGALCASEAGRDEATACYWHDSALSVTRCSFAHCLGRAHPCPGRSGSTCRPCRTTCAQTQLPSLDWFSRACGCNFGRCQNALKVQQVGMIQGQFDDFDRARSRWTTASCSRCYFLAQSESHP